MIDTASSHSLSSARFILPPGCLAPGSYPLIIYNPRAGGWRGHAFFRATLRALAERGCPVDVLATRGPGDAAALARAAAVVGRSPVVVAGGDGTIREAADALAGSASALAIIPLGTANVLTRNIGLARDPEAVAATLVAGVRRSVCLGRIRGAGGTTHRFLLMAGVGFDAHVVKTVSPILKRGLGAGAYVVAALHQGLRLPFFDYRIEIDGRPYEAVSAIVANGRHYAGSYVCAPEARLDDPHFHVCLFLRRGRFALARYALALARGTLAARRDVRIVAATRVRFTGPPGDPVQADGDLAAHLPVDMEIEPAALSLIVPPE